KSVMAGERAEEASGGLATSTAERKSRDGTYVHRESAPWRRIRKSLQHASSARGQNRASGEYGVRAGATVNFSTRTLHPADESSTGGESTAIDQGTLECSLLRSC